MSGRSRSDSRLRRNPAIGISNTRATKATMRCSTPSAGRAPKTGKQPPQQRGSSRRSLLFPDGFPHICLGLWSSGGVHVDIAIKVQIELFQNWDQSFNMIVSRLPGSHREVALEQNLLLGKARDHQPV